MITFEDIKKNHEIKTYIEASNQVLGAVGYTEHGFAHAMRTADIASRILRETGHDERTCELAMIAGYMHDIGNTINRTDHAQSGGLMAFQILTRLGLAPEETALIASAIGHHDEGTAAPVNAVAAALILADKSDVRRSRVRNREFVAADIHDRVNFAAQKSELRLNKEEKTIILKVSIDTEICAVMDYFEIFLTRMVLCRRAAEALHLKFELLINNSRLL